MYLNLPAKVEVEVDELVKGSFTKEVQYPIIEKYDASQEEERANPRSH